MNKTLIYFAPREKNVSSYLNKTWVGVDKKIENQLRQIRKLGYRTKLIYYSKKNTSNLWRNIINPFYSITDWKNIKIKTIPDVIYIRLGNIDIGLVKYLGYLKKLNKDVKIILEIATYPYKAIKTTNIQGKILYTKDCIFRRMLPKYVDRILTCAQGYKKIFGIKVLYVPNGVDYNEKVTIPNRDKKNNEIHLIAVSSMQYWHAYERVIDGIHEYYKKDINHRMIVLHLVGGGIEEKKYKKLVKKYNLEKHVVFEGFLEGEQLCQIYEQCQIAIGGLGVHRFDKNMVVSSLKLKEYAAYGLPVILSSKSDIESKETRKFLLKVPENEDPISMFKVIKFYDYLYESNKFNNIHEIIRNTFKSTCDINCLFKPVLDFLEKE